MVYVNRLNSIESVIPYEYHSFDVCTLDSDQEKKLSPSENLGQVLFGERIRASPYNVWTELFNILSIISMWLYLFTVDVQARRWRAMR